MNIEKIFPVGPINWRKNLEERRKEEAPKRERPKTKEDFIYGFQQFQEERKSKNFLDYMPWKFNRLMVIVFFFCYLTQSWVLFALAFYVSVFYNVFKILRR